jgi:hypothetical protein
MTVKELIEMLKTCDEESIVYIDYNGDINSINVEPADYRFVIITTTIK